MRIYGLHLVHSVKEKYETIRLCKQVITVRAAISELKGIANIIPKQSILINAIILQKAKDSSVYIYK
jgi:hypothetical protein